MKINVDPTLSPAEQRRMCPLTRHAPVYGEDGKLLGFNGETAADTYEDAELRAELELARPTAAAVVQIPAFVPALARGFARLLSQLKDERVLVFMEDLVDRRYATAFYKSFADEHAETHARLLNLALGSFTLTPREGFRKSMASAVVALLAAMPEQKRAKRILEILCGDPSEEFFACLKEFQPELFEDMVEVGVGAL
jgi:hypothetical protein